MARRIEEKDDNFRVVNNGGIGVIRRDFVPPVPVGSCIVKVFRVTGYSRDCDGSAMARLANVDFQGQETGWVADSLGLYPDSTLVVDYPSEVVKLIS